MTRPEQLATKTIHVFVLTAKVLLVTRLVFRLLGASVNNPLVAWVYDTTAVLLQPFRNLFPYEAGGHYYTLETVTLFAIAAYAFVGFVAYATVQRLAKR